MYSWHFDTQNIINFRVVIFQLFSLWLLPCLERFRNYPLISKWLRFFITSFFQKYNALFYIKSKIHTFVHRMRSKSISVFPQRSKHFTPLLSESAILPHWSIIRFLLWQNESPLSEGYSLKNACLGNSAKVRTAQNTHTQACWVTCHSGRQLVQSRVQLISVLNTVGYYCKMVKFYVYKYC